MNKIIFISFCVLVCSAQSVFGEKLNEKGLQYIQELAESVGSIQEYITDSARSQPIDESKLSAIRDSMDLLIKQLQGSGVAKTLNNPDSSSRNLNNVFQLKNKLQSLAGSLGN